MKYSRCLLLISLSCLLGISGCATSPPVLPPAGTPASGLVDWEFGGRAVLRHGKRSWRVDIRWQQHIDEYRVSLMSLLGQQIARLQGGNGQVVLDRPGQASVTARSPSALLAEEFGWNIPIEGLRYWVLGLPAPDVAEKGQRDRYGYLRTLEQQGWQIVFDRYRQADDAWLPGRLTLTRDGLSVRLVIDQWHLARGNFD